MTPSLFKLADTQAVVARIEKLTPDSRPLWGKMSVGQMLAHCCVTYEFLFDTVKYPPNGALKTFLLKLFLKNAVVGPKPYSKNSPTAPEFVIKETKDFSAEKSRLIGFIQRVQSMGESEFEGRKSRSFGPLTAREWNMMFYKHLDHHLRQFGV